MSSDPLQPFSPEQVICNGLEVYWRRSDSITHTSRSPSPPNLEAIFPACSLIVAELKLQGYKKLERGKTTLASFALVVLFQCCLCQGKPSMHHLAGKRMEGASNEYNLIVDGIRFYFRRFIPYTYSQDVGEEKPKKKPKKSLD